jgi:hypothetical protein
MIQERLWQGVYVKEIFFGYPEAHDNDAECAVRAGLAILDALAALIFGHPRLAARIGIDSGAMVVVSGAGPRHGLAFDFQRSSADHATARWRFAAAAARTARLRRLRAAAPNSGINKSRMPGLDFLGADQ